MTNDTDSQNKTDGNAVFAMSRALPGKRDLALLVIGFGCLIAFSRMCSLGFAGYLSYEAFSASDSWYAVRTVSALATLVVLALAGRNKWFKLGLVALLAVTACAIASAIVFAVDAARITGPVPALLGGVSIAVLMYVWMLLLSCYRPRVIVGVTLVGLLVSGALIQGASVAGISLGLIIVVAAAFVAGAAAIMLDPDLDSYAPDGPLDEAELSRVPWLTVVMVVVCGFFVSVLYGIAQHMTWLYDWQANYAVFGVATALVVAATAGMIFRMRGWMHVVWVPLFVLFAASIVFACLPIRSMAQVALGLMMAAVFCAHFLYWIIFPSLFSALKIPRAFGMGILLVCVNSSLASLIGDFLGSLLPRSMQNLGSVAGIMAILVAILFAVTYAMNRNRIGAVGVRLSDSLGSDQRALAVEAVSGGFESSAAADAGEAEESADAEAAEPANPVDALKARLDELVDQYGLTPRESEVAFYTVQGFSCAYIADKLVVSNSTVRFHQQNIYRKFEVHSRNELIEFVSGE